MSNKLSKEEADALTELKEALSRRYRLCWIKLIGSKARGESDDESDVDIVIVLENVDWATEKGVYEMCFYLGLDHDIVISPIIYSKREIEDSLTRITPFYNRVEAEGVLI